MPPVTEIAFITFKPGVELHGSGPEAKSWAETISTLQAQPGMQRINYGRLIEEPNTLILLVDWTTLEDHKTFMSSPQYEPFVGNLLPLITGLHMLHFEPAPFPSTVLDTAPVIEFATFFTISPTFHTNVSKFLEQAGTPRPDGYYGHAFGAAVEQDVKKHSEQGGDEKGSNALVLFIGWESKEKHMQFRETKQFAENINLLREGVEAAEMFHIQEITTISNM